MLYSLFCRRPKAFDFLKKALADFIIVEGLKLVKDEKLKTDDFVAKLISLRETVYEIFVKAMARDPQIDLSVKMAFEKVCNEENKTAKALVIYLDEMFKTEFKNI